MQAYNSAWNGPLFERKEIRTHSSPFFPSLNGCHTVCACRQVCEHVGACSGIRKLTGAGTAPCLCTLPVSEDHAVAHSARALFFLLLCLGRTHYMQPKTRAQKKSCGPQPGRVESWRCCLGPSSSWRCHAGGSLVANQGWAKFMCLFQTSWKTARGRGFEEWGILDMWCEHSLILFCMLAGLSSSPLMLFSSRTPRFMQQRRLSILAQKTELHCLLILVSHHFQIQVHKIKDEKHVVLVLALQKGKKNY